MDDVKGKMKGLVKNLTTSNSKFKGQGRVLGSASSSTPTSRLIPPQNPNPNPNPNPRPNTKLNPPNPKPSAEFSPFDPLITATTTTTTTNRSPSSAAAFNCPICSSPFRSESEVSAHIDSCLATNPDVESANVVVVSVGLYLSNRPPKESVEVVLRLLSNVVKEPGNEKFRRIRMGNPKIKEAVGDVKGGVELLECVGFRVWEEEEEAEGEVWATMEAPAEDGARVIRAAVALLEWWKEGDAKEESAAINNNGGGVEENKVVVRKKTDRKFVSSSLKEQCLEFELLCTAVAELRVVPRFTIVGDRRPPTLEEERLVPSALVQARAHWDRFHSFYWSDQ